MPKVYTGFQDFVGARSARQRIVDDVLEIRSGDRVLDVGCGPADILAFLPQVDYLGIDYSEDYIDAARRRFGNRGRFLAADVSSLRDQGITGFDVVIALGVLHHLDDVSAKGLMRDVRDSLKPGGRFVCVDPLIEYPQNPIARLLARLDRGQFVRTREGYSELARSVFAIISVEPRRDLLRVPYSHAITRCSL
ncbi:Methyltransferase domain-containing protein [Mesorhizobium albiziae]|uniref:Methyltransferase domain-containing protein n=1 Tax=Neomesorhizobium albiziae TaxID=335020 RepID=A0A1I4DYF7_9HYPH|nr:class I SAM-dependent methyltransferase [Mesorhizobium albiziae]SFK97297.1 Methyltransferase domain-containing protein [Mesorhizobium albiziae]